MSEDKPKVHVVRSAPLTVRLGIRDSQFNIEGVTVTESLYNQYKDHERTPELVEFLKRAMEHPPDPPPTRESIRLAITSTAKYMVGQFYTGDLNFTMFCRVRNYLEGLLKRSGDDRLEEFNCQLLNWLTTEEWDGQKFFEKHFYNEVTE